MAALGDKVFATTQVKDHFVAVVFFGPHLLRIHLASFHANTASLSDSNFVGSHPL
jgi:hypothetical protein